MRWCLLDLQSVQHLLSAFLDPKLSRCACGCKGLESVMEAGFAKACIRYIIGKELADESKKAHGTLYRKVFGLTTAALQKKRVVLSNDLTGIVKAFSVYPEDAFVCAYVFTDKSAGMEELVFNAAKDVVMACVTTTVGSMAAGGSFGTSVIPVNKAYEMAGGIGGAKDVKDSMLSGGSNIGTAAYEAGQAVVAASARSFAKGTTHEFSTELPYAIDMGVCAIYGDGKTLTVEINRYGTGPMHSERLLRALSRHSGERGRQYLRECSAGLTYTYDAATHKFERGSMIWRGVRSAA
jgi:hypothetical protein